MTKTLFLIILYSVMLILLWGASRFFLYMESLGRQMVFQRQLPFRKNAGPVTYAS
jgi:hypothetical protein